MPSLPAVLLEHTTSQGVHYDWMLADPADPEGLLWTARTGTASADWKDAWELEQIGQHRRHYLTHEGDIGGGRGRVRRVDEGTFTPVQWSDQRIVLDLAMRHFRGRVRLTRLHGPRWRAEAIGSCSNV